MNMDISGIPAHLRKEIELYKEFIPVLQKEMECVVARDYKTLYETIGAKESLLLRILAMGRKRSDMLNEAAMALGIKGEVNLTAIMEKTQGPLKSEIGECQATILQLMETIKDLSRVNSITIANSLENIKKTLGFLSNFMPSASYGPTGAFDGGLTSKGVRLSKGA